MIMLAKKLTEKINESIEKDQGAEFRRQLGLAMAEATKLGNDAFDPKLPGFRSHFGISTSGNACSRSLWYGWRWVGLPVFTAQILRLFNRGHLEEMRFVAALRCAGVEVFQADEHGKQFRVSLYGGHYGSAIDGVGVNIPDLPDASVPCLLEFKTHNEKSYRNMVNQGLKKSKPKHYGQMVQYLEYWKLDWGLYGASNKNTDELYWEIIQRNEADACRLAERSYKIIFAKNIPPRYSENPSDYECQFCDHKMRCHYGVGDVAVNCRTCRYGMPQEQGQWVCLLNGDIRDKVAQEAACGEYDKHPDL